LRFNPYGIHVLPIFAVLATAEKIENEGDYIFPNPGADI
jgi:hypothetical protein